MIWEYLGLGGLIKYFPFDPDKYPPTAGLNCDNFKGSDRHLEVKSLISKCLALLNVYTIPIDRLEELEF